MKALNRVNPLGMQFYITEVPGDSTVSIRTGGKTIIVDCQIEELNKAWRRWQMDGWKVQDAFPFLASHEREFLQTGITPKEWNEMFKETEE
jgi:hypothetical protein